MNIKVAAFTVSEKSINIHTPFLLVVHSIKREQVHVTSCGE